MAAACNQSVDAETVLLRRAAAGDRAAFEELYRLHVGKVYGLCLRLMREGAAAEDATQETFIRAWRSLGRFEARSCVGTWLHRIAVRVVLSRRRRIPRWLALPELADPAAPDAVERESDWLLDTPVEVGEIERAIDELPRGARDALVLCAIYGYSHAEVAGMLGVAEGTCKAQLHRARALLRLKLSLERRT